MENITKDSVVRFGGVIIAGIIVLQNGARIEKMIEVDAQSTRNQPYWLMFARTYIIFSELLFSSGWFLLYGSLVVIYLFFIFRNNHLSVALSFIRKGVIACSRTC